MRILSKTVFVFQAFMIFVVVLSAFPSSEFKEHIKRIIQSDEIDGYDFATLRAVDPNTNREIRQRKRDIRTHATDLSSTKRSFSLQLTSGERLRMRLDRRSIDTSGIMFSELTADGEKPISLRSANCFFSGHLEQQEEGFASVAMCDGELMGSITTAKRQYTIYALHHADHKRATEEDDVRVLVTWQSNERRRGLHDGMNIPVSDHNVTATAKGKRNLSVRKATIEIGDYVDDYFIQNVKTKLGITTNNQIINLIVNKWSAVTNLLANTTLAGWDLTLRLVKVVIMRTHPSWYTASPSDTILARVKKICKGTKAENYDHVTLHTGHTSNPGYLGMAWIGGLCQPQWRCSAMISANTDFWTELHELGHSLGLNHDDEVAECQSDGDDKEGFMANNRDHLRQCYRQLLLQQLAKPESECVFHNAHSKYIEEFHNDHLGNQS